MEKRFQYRYFVDRDDELKDLHSAAQNPDTRMFWIEGDFGIGKTKIMNEFKADLRNQRARLVHIDLKNSKDKLGYMFVITEIRNDLGRAGFEPVSEAILELNPSKGMPDPGLSPTQMDQLKALLAAIPEGEGGQVDFRGDTKMDRSQVAGNAILNFINYYGHPRDQNRNEEEISLVLRDCLFEVSQNERLVFILDHWENANDVLQEWLNQYLLAWCLDQPDFNAFAVIGCENLPEWYEERFDVEKKKLNEFTDDIVRIYWIEVRKLPPESLYQQDSANLHNPTILARRAQSVKDQIDNQKKSD